MAESEPIPFQISISRYELQKLTGWGKWAKQMGVLDDFWVALKTINYRVSFEPMEWGEPRYTLRHLHLKVRFGTVKMLNDRYGVNTQKQVVFVKTFQFRGDYPPGRPPES